MAYTLAIDTGNTRVKVGVFESGTLKAVHAWSYDAKEQGMMAHFFENLESPNGVIVSSVRKTLPESIQGFAKKHQSMLLNHTTPVPFMSSYQTPETLGLDRIALAAAAIAEFPQQDVLVIDAGTCITLDVISANGSYLGGAIAPGVQMRLKAMHHFTQNLPEVRLENHADLIGRTTKDCMLTGSLVGAAHEINGAIAAFQAQFTGIKTVLTGGDTNALGKFINYPIFARPDFTLYGLHAILHYHHAQ